MVRFTAVPAVPVVAMRCPTLQTNSSYRSDPNLHLHHGAERVWHSKATGAGGAAGKPCFQHARRGARGPHTHGWTLATCLARKIVPAREILLAYRQPEASRWRRIPRQAAKTPLVPGCSELHHSCLSSTRRQHANGHAPGQMNRVRGCMPPPATPTSCARCPPNPLQQHRRDAARSP